MAVVVRPINAVYLPALESVVGFTYDVVIGNKFSVIGLNVVTATMVVNDNAYAVMTALRTQFGGIETTNLVTLSSEPTYLHQAKQAFEMLCMQQLDPTGEPPVWLD